MAKKTMRLMKGNEALAEAAIQAGCRFYAGYPITPQNEIPEYLSRRMPEVKGVFIPLPGQLINQWPARISKSHYFGAFIKSFTGSVINGLSNNFHGKMVFHNYHLRVSA